MRELSLFSGAGGGLLGTKLLGWEAVGYVERDPYCQAVLEARIRDGLLDPAPIFGDIRAFLRSGDCDRFAGRVDVVTAGFPCQPFSVAGKRLGADDERNLWPETADVLRRVRPRFALLENVPGLVASGYFGTVLGDLAALGFDAEWTVLGADDAGAPHIRKRLWILAHRSGDGRLEGWAEPARIEGRPDAAERGVAHANSAGLEEQRGAESVREEQRTAERGRPQGPISDPERDALRLERERDGEQRGEPREALARGDGEEVADAHRGRLESQRLGGLLDGEREALGHDTDGCDGAEVADAARDLRPEREAGRAERKRAREGGEPVGDAHRPRLGHGGERHEGPSLEGLRAGMGEAASCPGGGSWWLHDPADEGPESLAGLGLLADGLARGLDEPRAAAEAFVPRVARGVPHRVQQLRALGNGQVPATVALAWKTLMERIDP